MVAWLKLGTIRPQSDTPSGTNNKQPRCMYLSNLHHRKEGDARSIFKQSEVGLNSEFFFSNTGCLTKVIDPSLSYYLFLGGREKSWIHTFP